MFHAPALAVFSTACLGVLPLAGYMGEATEHLAHRTGPTIGGLLNATFGNAAELIISLVALQAGLVGLVKASITGSILGNLLLILGLSLVVGGSAEIGAQVQSGECGNEREYALAGGHCPGPCRRYFMPYILEAPLGSPSSGSPKSVAADPAPYLWLVTALHPKTHRCLFWSESPPMEGPIWTIKKAVAGPGRGDRGSRHRVRAPGPRGH